MRGDRPGWRPLGDTGWLLDVPAVGDPLDDARRVLAIAEQVRRRIADDRIADDRIAHGQIADDRIADDRIAHGQIADDRIADDRIAHGRVRDVVPAAATVLVTTEPAHHTAVGHWLAGLDVSGAAGETPVGGVRVGGVQVGESPVGDARVGGVRVGGVRVGDTRVGDALVLRASFDGPDLADVGGLLGIGSDEVVERVASTVWTVAFTGFAPGFGYLVGGGLDVPRLPAPRAWVPAGSLALAGPYAGVYPRDSPGGWRLVGRLVDPPSLFDPARRPPALLVPGTTVVVERVS